MIVACNLKKENMEDNQEHNIEFQAEDNEEPKKPSLLVRYAKLKSKNIRLLIIGVLLIIATSIFIIAAYFCWLDWLPSLWKWGFKPTTWRAFFSVWGALMLIVIPFIGFSLFSDNITDIYSTIIEDAENEINNKLKEVETKQKDYLEKIESHDKQGLISLITFSKIELEQYYRIGLTQTQKSYRYSMLSMWIGFLIIMFGIIPYLIPVLQINHDFLNGNLQILIIGSGIIIELISALFLWIYKDSVSQLRYFYNRQIFIHNSLFAYKISESMEKPDRAKQIIIEKILEFGLSNKEKLHATKNIVHLADSAKNEDDSNK